MQTFIPHQTFAGSARVLDDQRLGKQRIEASQILGVLVKREWSQDEQRFVTMMPLGTVAWGSHPAVLMWQGAERGLLRYIDAMCAEWRRRGHHDHIQERVLTIFNEVPAESKSVPDWLDGDEVCSSHRAVLLGKDYHHYSQFGWLEKPAVKDSVTGRWPYVWPVSSTAT
jgi:hypothetical protein